jgi:hypothetical protein
MMLWTFKNRYIFYLFMVYIIDSLQILIIIAKFIENSNYIPRPPKMRAPAHYYIFPFFHQNFLSIYQILPSTSHGNGTVFGMLKGVESKLRIVLVNESWGNSRLNCDQIHFKTIMYECNWYYFKM